jgi:hypothetical protein
VGRGGAFFVAVIEMTLPPGFTKYQSQVAVGFARYGGLSSIG